tara:strand:- start:15812 stop:16003 length:192 start_codon:yes stop_codon:yes gene_type:complete
VRFQALLQVKTLDSYENLSVRVIEGTQIKNGLEDFLEVIMFITGKNLKKLSKYDIIESDFRKF